MAFSPAVNFQTDDDTFHLFWPGADTVDVIGCIWYTNGATPGATTFRAIERMKKYFLHRTGANRPFGIDEIGGWDPVNQDNNAFLKQMFQGIQSLDGRVALDYVTLFFQNALPNGARWNHNPNPALLF
ncbi:hypothetical protein BH11ARM2_BH11ARM2_07910 [soil metagenome]